MIATIYSFAPSQRQAFGKVISGAAAAALVWAAGTLIFSKAVSSVLQFGVTYGSFSAAIVLLVYLYLAAAGLLLGAELNRVLAGRREAGMPHGDPRGRSTAITGGERGGESGQ